jgi:hypothetical protein
LIKVYVNSLVLRKYYLPDTFVPPDGLGVEAKPDLWLDDEPTTTLLPERDPLSCEHIV